MKLQGILGGGTGKLGESVFTNNAGRTIVRQYNPHVRNPRTARQQNSRSRFKMASELAKLFAQPLRIGMPRIGALTSRNLFTSKIIPVSAGVIELSGNDLRVNYESVMLSKGGMPSLNASGVAYDSSTHKYTITMDNAYNPEAKGYVPPMPGVAGVVLVLLDGTYENVHVYQALAGNNATVQIEVPSTIATACNECYVFAKWVPEAYNDIQAETLPWKFPSDQSETEYFEIQG